MNLTNEEIGIKVAEAMGWREEKEPVGSANASAWWHNNDRYPAYLTPVPNYPLDLNACAEFEATLTDAEWNIYCGEIVNLTQWNRATDTVKRILQATARQRCLAYLKTKGIIQ